MSRRAISLVVLITFLFSNISYASDLYQSKSSQGNINLAPPLLFGPLGEEDHKLLAIAQIGLELDLRKMDEMVDIDKATDTNTILTAFRKNNNLNQDREYSANTIHSPAKVTTYFTQLEQISAHIFVVPISVEKKNPGNNVVRKDYRLLFSTLRRDGGFPSAQCTKDELDALKGDIRDRDALPKRVERDAEAIRRYIEHEKAAPAADSNTRAGKALDNAIRNARDAGRTRLYEYEIYDVLKLLGVNVPQYTIVNDPDNMPQLPKAAKKLVLKIISSSLHKSDETIAGGMIRGVEIVVTEEAPWFIRKMFMIPGAKGVLVYPFVENAAGPSELLLGFTDADLGRLICFGQGGLYTDYRPDRAYRDYRLGFSAEELIASTEIGKQFIQGSYRSKRLPLKAGELEAFIEKLTAFKLYYDKEGKFDVSGLEINPLMCLPDGQLFACDAKLEFTQKKPAAKVKPVERLRKLLHPRSVGVTGVVSDRWISRVGAAIPRILDNLIRTWKGPLYIKGETGGKAYKGVKLAEEVPDDCDLCIVLNTPKEGVMVAKDRLGKGSAVVLIGAGFGEVEGDAATKLNQSLQAAIDEAHPDGSLVGPNTMGIITPELDALFSDESAGVKASKDSNIAFISQSGAFLAAAASSLALRNTYIHYGFSIGNAADLGAADYLEYIIENEPQIKVVAMYLEASGGDRLGALIKRAREKSISVIIRKGGTTEEGAKSTVSHTASSAGKFEHFKAVLEQAGAVVLPDTGNYDLWVDTVYAASHFAAAGFPKGNRIFAISSGGEDAVAMTDAQAVGGRVVFPQPDEALRSFIQSLKILNTVKIPFDITAGTSVDKIRQLLEYAGSSDAFDLLLFAYLRWLPPLAKDTELIQYIKDRKGSKPLVMILKDDSDTGRAVKKGLREAGVLVFDTPQRAIFALGAVLKSTAPSASPALAAGRPSQGIAGPYGHGSASENDKGPSRSEGDWIGKPVEDPIAALEAFIKGAGKMDISSARNFETLKAMSAQEIKDKIKNAGLVIGVPKEIKAGAARVGLTPAGVKLLTAYGVVVIVEKGAGVLSGFGDEEYADAGARIAETAKEVWDRAAIIKKVKEPMGAELDMMRPGQTIFTYLHLASPELRSLTEELITGDVTAIGYETIETDESGKKVTPLLRPMSAIAGDLGGYFAMFYHLASNISEHEGVKKVVLDRAGSDMAAWVKSHYPEAEEFKGLMLDKKAVILGGGISGEHMAQRLLEAGAKVTITDTDGARRKELERIFDKYIQDGRLTVVDPGSDINNPSKELKEIYKFADIMGGCILLRGGVAPKMSKELLAEISSPNKGGRAKTIVDIALDQGGNFYGSYSRPYDDPVFVDQYGNRRFCVTNMPDAVGNIASVELEKTNIVYQIALAMGYEEAKRVFPELESGLNVANGKIICKAVSDSYADVKGREDLLAATKFLSLGYFTDNAKFVNSLVDATNDTYWDGDKEVIIALSGALLKAGQKGDYLEFLNKIRINENEKIQLRVQASIAIHEAGYQKESEEKFWMETVSKRGLHNYARISAAAALVKARYAGTGMIDLENTKYLFVIRALKRALMSVIIKGETTRKTGIRATEDTDPEHSMPGVRLRILAMGALLWSGIDVEKNLSDLRKIRSDINVAMSVKKEAQAELLSYERMKIAQVPSAASSVRLSHLARHEFINALIKMFLRLNKADKEGFLLEQTIDHIKFYWFGEKYAKNSTFLDVFNKLVEIEAVRQKRGEPNYNDEISVVERMVRLAGFRKMKVDQNFLRELKQRLGQPMIEHLSVYKYNSVYAMRSHIGLALTIKDHAKLEGKLHRAAMEGTFVGDREYREKQYEKWRSAPNGIKRVELQLEDEKISLHQTMSYNEFAQWAHDKAEERYPLSGRTAPSEHAVLYNGAIMGPQVPASGIGPSDSDDELVLTPVESDRRDAPLLKGEVIGINSIFSAHGTHIGGVEKKSAPPQARRGDLLPGTGIGGERQNIGLGGTDIPEFRAVPVSPLPEEYYANGLDVSSLAGEISGMGYPIRIDEKSALIFSEKVTFDNGLGILLPKLANSGIKVAVIATNDTQRKLIDGLNSGKPENQKIVYAGSIVEATTKIKAARFFYFKIEAEADAGVSGITNITIIAEKIIKILGNVCGISDARLLEQMYEAARKFAQAA